VRYILTYTETKNGITSMGNSRFSAQSDTEAGEYIRNLLDGRDVTDITLWRRGDFVMLGRESI
jgi:predicted lipid carrier protein YhbT